MAKIGMTLSRDRADDPLALHFGKAKWLAIFDGDGPPRFIQNVGLNGRWVASQFAKERVDEVIAWRLGPGAFTHLRAFGIRILEGKAATPASELALAAKMGRLRELSEPTPHSAGANCGGHGDEEH